MRKTTLLVFIFVLLLAACASPVTTEAPPTEKPQEEETNPLADSEPSPAETETITATEMEPQAGVTVYKIIPGDSTLVYEVGEVFLNQGNQFNLAVGTTPQVEGEIRVDTANPQNSTIGSITSDISQFTSDSGRRDSALQNRFLESSRYPVVTFVPEGIEGLPSSYQEGQEVNMVINGDLTIREVTQPVTFDAVVKLENNELSGQATTTILMSDFGFGPIDIGGILKTEDEAKVTLTLIARP